MKGCRICNKANFSTILSLGTQPLANGFLRREDLKKKEKTYPLVLERCTFCNLVQLKDVVSAAAMFKNYLYIPSTSKTRTDHFYELAGFAVENFKLAKNDFVVDIGSNDGSLLLCFKEFGFPIVGVDPSENLAKVAEMKGIPTLTEFFTQKVARQIVSTFSKAKIITATNVFAHVDNLKEFVRGIELLLSDKGVFIIEFPYLLDFLQQCQFDTIYHEHLSYFALQPLLALFDQTQLEIFDITHMDLDGGSLRVFVGKKGRHPVKKNTLSRYLSMESQSRLDTENPYVSFTQEVRKRKKKLRSLIKTLKKKGKKIVGYGAPAKGNVLLNYCGITKKEVVYVVDSTPYKQGLFMPGSHIPIFPESKIQSSPPDYILILAWNFADEIIKKNENLRKQGTRFIIL